MNTQPSREELTTTVVSLPLVELTDADPILTEVDSLAVMHDLDAAGSTLPIRLQLVRDLVMSEVTADLTDVHSGTHYVVTERELTGAITRAIRRGATQAIVDYGTAVGHIDDFYARLGITESVEESEERTDF